MEIEYWRNSIAPSATIDVSLLDEADEEPMAIRSQREATPEAAPVLADAHDEHTATRHTFDFGILASSMQEDQKVCVEERVLTLEVKIMDLEYAISKIQARSPSPQGPAPRTQTPPLKTEKSGGNSAAASPLSMREARQSPTSSHTKTLGSLSSTKPGSTSTQLTAYSNDEDPSSQPKDRPTSTATTVRQTPLKPLESRDSQSVNRVSITSLTIDHFTTLIGLIRREQAARIRLEDQVVELQREVDHLRPASPPLSSIRSRNRSRAWTGDKDVYSIRHVGPSDYGRGRPLREYDDLDTDEEGSDVYETPTERKTFEGSVAYNHSVEGEAF